jgi:hypothetical protein
MTTYGPEFREIGHCGGKITVTISTDANGRRAGSTRYESSRPNPAAWFGVYALPQGFSVGVFRIGGIGQPFTPDPPHPDCLTVFVGSDSQGFFGHQCSACKGYWRSKEVPLAWPITCPYCGRSGDAFQFLTAGQHRFIAAVCRLTVSAMTQGDGEHTIDLDKVADETASSGERPSFYYTEETQQNYYTCDACGGADDILGRYGYCSCCGTRNDVQELRRTIEAINAKTRERLKAREQLEAAVPDAVSAFDSAARQYAKQLATWVLMKPQRRASLEGALFHNLKKKAQDLEVWFGIDLFEGVDANDVEFIRLMFYRRHVYEHNGGEVDQKYLDESGDTSVRLKQALRETPESIFRMTGLIMKMAHNLHEGFHELFPPMEQPIKAHQEQRARVERFHRGSG